MPKLSLFDPPMRCCSGICGPVEDPTLARIATDLDWLKRHGVEVERFSPSQQPAAFVLNRAVANELRDHGDASLPLLLIDDRIVCCGHYPVRDELVKWVGLEVAR